MTRPYWVKVLGGVILSFLYSGMNGGIVWASKYLVDEIIVHHHYAILKIGALGALVVYAARGTISFAQTYVMKSAGMGLIRDTRNRFYRHILGLPSSFFTKESSGMLISRMMNDVESLGSILATVVRAAVVEVPTVIVLIGIAFYRKWDLTLMILVLFPFIAFNARKFGKRIKKKRKEAQKKIALLTQKIGETIQGAKVVKIFNREDYMAGRFGNENNKYYREMIRVIRNRELATLVTDIATGVGVSIIVLYGYFALTAGGMTPGDFVSIFFAVNMIFSPVKKISDAYTSLQEVRASIDRIDTVMSAPHEEIGTVRIDGFKKAIEFRDVAFSYRDGTPVLAGLDLEIRPGDVVAVVGRSGVGKTTLVDLLPRLIKITGGRLTIDGISINEIEVHSLRELTGIVSQDIMLFNDTIRENIAFGRPNATEEEIVRAAELSFSHEFITALPEGYETVIGERGVKLSGGQRQRIAIARAILRNPPILILDEATSSLDTVSEALVQKALETLMIGRTTIIIAHRLSTIKNATRIVVIDNGRIVDTGRHEELIGKSGVYAELYNTFALSK